jgi:hypothetical protein
MKMSLKDKLQKLREAQMEREIKEENTPAKEEEKEPAPASTQVELPGAAIRAKLQALGAKKEVNPPTDTPDFSDPAHNVVVAVEKAPPEEKEETHEETKEEKASEEICPTCQKAFKVLAKHRCKVPTGSNVALAGTARPVKMLREKLEQMRPNTSEARHDYVLLIDCFPLTPCDFVQAEKICRPVIEAICEEKNVEHWKLIEYGGGPALLQTRFEMFWYGQHFAGTILLNSQSLEYPSIKEALITWAKAVYQG